MSDTLYLERVETIPDDANVFHYDELPDKFKDRFPLLVGSSTAKAPIEHDCLLASGDFVKFTDYYCVTDH